MNLGNLGWWGIAGAAISAVIAFMSQIKAAFSTVFGLFVVTVQLDYSLASIIDLYLTKKFKFVGLGSPVYSSYPLYVKKLERVRSVGIEDYTENGKQLFFRRGLRFLCISNDGQNLTTISFIRGMFDRTSLVKEAVEFYNNEKEQAAKEYRINYVFGSLVAERGRFRNNSQNNGHKDQQIASAGSMKPLFTLKLVGMALDDVGAAKDVNEYVIPTSLKPAIEEIKFWRNNKDWYREHRIPWRRGWILNGAPGSGKTSLVRHVAESLNLPVFVYDLNSMTNGELRFHWTNTLSSTPCIILIEDIDSVFDKRKNLNAESEFGGGLTFDCLLNCLDGIECINGLFVIITSNDLSKVDDALINRPGRIDRCLVMPEAVEEDYRALCSKILIDYQQDWDELVAKAVESKLTMAKFQEECFKTALKHKWEELQEPKVRLDSVKLVLQPDWMDSDSTKEIRRKLEKMYECKQEEWKANG